MSIDPNWNWANSSCNNVNYGITTSNCANTFTVKIPVVIDPNIHVVNRKGKLLVRFDAAGLEDGKYHQFTYKRKKCLLHKDGKNIDIYQIVSDRKKPAKRVKSKR